jgi:hypothetical protein
MKLTAFAVTALVTLATSALSQQLTWDLRGNDGQGPAGNVMMFETGGVTVTATAWSHTQGANEALEAAGLGQWSTGLGVQNPNERSGSPDHQVSNADGNDFVLFVFDAPMDVETVRIDPYGEHDRDVTYWSGNVDPSLGLTGATYSDLAALGFGPQQDDTSSSSESARNVPIATADNINALLFGARIEGTPEDYFKIAKITGAVVPEPGTAILAALGLAGALLRRRR